MRLILFLVLQCGCYSLVLGFGLVSISFGSPPSSHQSTDSSPPASTKSNIGSGSTWSSNWFSSFPGELSNLLDHHNRITSLSARLSFSPVSSSTSSVKCHALVGDFLVPKRIPFFPIPYPDSLFRGGVVCDRPSTSDAVVEVSVTISGLQPKAKYLLYTFEGGRDATDLTVNGVSTTSLEYGMRRQTLFPFGTTVKASESGTLIITRPVQAFSNTISHEFDVGHSGVSVLTAIIIQDEGASCEQPKPLLWASSPSTARADAGPFAPPATSSALSLLCLAMDSCPTGFRALYTPAHASVCAPCALTLAAHRYTPPPPPLFSLSVQTRGLWPPNGHFGFVYAPPSDPLLSFFQWKCDALPRVRVFDAVRSPVTGELEEVKSLPAVCTDSQSCDQHFRIWDASFFLLRRWQSGYRELIRTYELSRTCRDECGQPFTAVEQLTVAPSNGTRDLPPFAAKRATLSGSHCTDSVVLMGRFDSNVTYHVRPAKTLVVMLEVRIELQCPDGPADLLLSNQLLYLSVMCTGGPLQRFPAPFADFRALYTPHTIHVFRVGLHVFQCVDTVHVLDEFAYYADADFVDPSASFSSSTSFPSSTASPHSSSSSSTSSLAVLDRAMRISFRVRQWPSGQKPIPMDVLPSLNAFHEGSRMVMKDAQDYWFNCRKEEPFFSPLSLPPVNWSMLVAADFETTAAENAFKMMTATLRPAAPSRYVVVMIALAGFTLLVLMAVGVQLQQRRSPMPQSYYRGNTARV